MAHMTLTFRRLSQRTLPFRITPSALGTGISMLGSDVQTAAPNFYGRQMNNESGSRLTGFGSILTRGIAATVAPDTATHFNSVRSTILLLVKQVAVARPNRSNVSSKLLMRWKIASAACLARFPKLGASSKSNSAGSTPNDWFVWLFRFSEMDRPYLRFFWFPIILPFIILPRPPASSSPRVSPV